MPLSPKSSWGTGGDTADSNPGLVPAAGTRPTESGPDYAGTVMMISDLTMDTRNDLGKS